MREDRDFDNIIDGMQGVPQAMMPPPPPPSRKERLNVSLKVLAASVIVFLLQMVTIGISMMAIHSIIIDAYGFTVAGIGFVDSLYIAMFLILSGSAWRKATS